jgi:hypothetical protein
MCVTARPRVGGRRAVERQCRGGPRRDRPLMGSRPRPPPEGEGGDEIVLVCIVVRKGNVCIDLTWNVCVFSGNCFWEGQVWSFLSIFFHTSDVFGR